MVGEGVQMIDPTGTALVDFEETLPSSHDSSLNNSCSGPRTGPKTVTKLKLKISGFRVCSLDQIITCTTIMPNIIKWKARTKWTSKYF